MSTIKFFPSDVNAMGAISNLEGVEDIKQLTFFVQEQAPPQNGMGFNNNVQPQIRALKFIVVRVKEPDTDKPEPESVKSNTHKSK